MIILVVGVSIWMIVRLVLHFEVLYNFFSKVGSFIQYSGYLHRETQTTT